MARRSMPIRRRRWPPINHDVYFDYGKTPLSYPPWFSGNYLSASDTTGTTQTFTINTPYASSGAASLTVNLWSLTQSLTVVKDHVLEVLINGQPAGQPAAWSGGDMFQLTFQIPSSALVAGVNSIQLVTPPIAGVTSQISFLHSLSCTYTRQLDGSQPVSVFNTGSATALYELNNLPSADAWVVDVRSPGPRGAGAIRDAGPGRWYI